MQAVVDTLFCIPTTCLHGRAGQGEPERTRDEILVPGGDPSGVTCSLAWRTYTWPRACSLLALSVVSKTRGAIRPVTITSPVRTDTGVRRAFVPHRLAGPPYIQTRTGRRRMTSSGTGCRCPKARGAAVPVSTRRCCIYPCCGPTRAPQGDGFPRS